jgi:tRNA U34 5-methylaminomethyl-2-thiouridine-forming methyltransferase MnmC
MPAPIQPPAITWHDGRIPVATAFGDPYFSLDGGLAETRHVFLAGNGLPDRLRDGFRVAELGVGTGLNLIALALAAADRGVTVAYTGFEAYPLAAADMARALAAFPETGALVPLLLAQWGRPRLDLPGVRARVIHGDARATLPAWDGRADAWFLDGFAPAKNPDLWEPALLAQVAAHTAPGGSFATYTAAGHVRRALAAAGFSVDRRPGFGRKRHMTAGRLP